MTVHIALSNDEGAILLSDSQGTIAGSESHGNQKQFVADNFVVGGAGHGGIVDRLFSFLDQKSNLRSSDAVDTIETFFETEIRREQLSTTSVILVAPGEPPSPEKMIHVFEPGTYVHFSAPTNCMTTGSGCEFVARAWRNRSVLGIMFPSESLADLTVEAVFCADAANESLGVDDQLLISFMKDRKAYCLGDGKLRLKFAPDEVKNKWRTEIDAKWREIREMATAINDEIREAVRLFSSIRTGNLMPFSISQFKSTNRTVAQRRQQLETKLAEYFDWYDQLLNR